VGVDRLEKSVPPSASVGHLKRLPKVDLHVHLEGALSPECLLELAWRNDREDEIRSPADAERVFSFSTPTEFFRQFLYVSRFVSSATDLRIIVDDVLGGLARDGVIYAEITLAPRKFVRKGVPYPALVATLEEAVDKSPYREKLDVRFVMDMVRDLGPDRGLELVDWMRQRPSPLVTGIGLGGSEGYPPELSGEPFAAARELGLHRTVHAGEGSGPPSIWGAIERLGAERIDHGTRAFEDPNLVEYLARERIPLNMCLTSNLRMGVIERYEDHPAQKYLQAGIPVTLGTDDPSFFGTTLSRELEIFAATFGAGVETLVEFQRNAIDASFLGAEEKEELRKRFEAALTLAGFRVS